MAETAILRRSPPSKSDMIQETALPGDAFADLRIQLQEMQQQIRAASKVDDRDSEGQLPRLWFKSNSADDECFCRRR
jgi:hypothetical protein